MVAVALISAFITMRLAIHGREAVVPAVTGLTVADAARAASGKGLSLTLENSFYSSEVPAGRILAQDPAPGLRVRRDWPVRIIESLGPQRVAVPDLTGESERAATVSIRRLSLELGTVARLAVPGEPDVVLAQTPAANSTGVDGPRISLLVSDADDSQPAAYVMPSLIGLSYAAASYRAAATGLRLLASTDSPQPASGAPAPADQPAPPPVSGIVLAQTPQAGRRVVRGDSVQIILGQPSSPASAPQ